MKSIIFRTPRIETELVVRVSLQEISNGKLMPGQLTTTMVNISQKGACLILFTLDINGKHLFFDTLNSDHYNVLLSLGNDHGDNGGFIIAAQSVWMDSCEHEGKHAFKVGVQFLHKQKKLLERLKRGEIS